MIVVIDSGVWISAFAFGGTPGSAIDLAFARHQIAICEQIILEVQATLVRKFCWRDGEVLEVLQEYLSDAMLIETPGKLSGVCRDPKDDMVFECALEASAELIISGDKDLQSVGIYEGISVLTDRQFIERYSS